MKSKIILSLIILFVVLVVVGYFSARTFTKPKEIKIGLLFPLSGNLQDYGKMARDGTILAINEFNSQQKRIKVIPEIKNNEGEKEKTEEGIKELIKDEKVLGIIGPLISSNTFVAGEIAQKEGIVLITPSATHPKISELGDYVFRTCPSDAWQGIDLARFAVLKLNYRKVAILYQGDEEYSKGLAEVFEKEINNLGGEIVAKEEYLKEDTNFESQLKKIKEKEPELIFVPGYTKQAVLIAQQMKRLGMEKIQFLGGDGVGSPEFINLGGKSVEGVIATFFFDTKNPDPRVKKFVENYSRVYGEEPSWIAAHAYDATWVLLDAISKSKKFNREEIKELVSQTKEYPGVTGNITFDQNGDPLNKTILKMRVEGGEWKLVEK
jgi:branched-chain amino acid transport system substrate-binding protein